MIIYVIQAPSATLQQLMLQDEIAEVMADEVVATARELASRKIDGTNTNPSSPGEPPAVQTGELFRSIRVVPGVGMGSGEREVEAGAEYAGFLEYGTSKMSPRPFMEPAIRDVMARREEIAERVIDHFGPLTDAVGATMAEVFGGPMTQFG